MSKYRLIPDETRIDIDDNSKCKEQASNGWCGNSYLYLSRSIRIRLTIYHLIVAVAVLLAALFFLYSSLTDFCLAIATSSSIIDHSSNERARIASCDSWISSLSNATVQHCPPAAILFPCSCALGQIQCYNQNVVNLKPIFERIANYIETQCVRQQAGLLNHCTNKFIRLELDGLDVRYLEDNFLYGLSFESVALKNLKQLTRIDGGAFRCSSQRLKQLSLEGETSYFLTDKNLPQLASVVETAPNLIRLYLDAYHLRRIPSLAFNNSNLEDVSFNFNRQRKGIITVLNNRAFFLMEKLTTIDLYEQNIRYLPEQPFTIRNDRSDLPPLSIYLQNNRLVSDSFDPKTFSQIQRSLFLYLEYNNLTYIDQPIFEPFFQANKRNMVDFNNNPLEMDCRTRWIAGLKSRYQQILGGHIDQDRLLVNVDAIDYKHKHRNCSSISLETKT